jgi:DNA-binding NtrC family response regulator
MAQRVLIVDDERSIRLTLSQTIESMGFEMAAAMTGEEALACIAAEPFDLVLLDIRLPGLDGIEVLRQLVAEQPHLKVIIITAHGTVDNAVEALKLGAVDFVQKPFTPDEIRSLVRRVIDRDVVEQQRADDYQSCLELAKRAMVRQQYEAATVHLRAAMQHEPNRPEAFNLLGMVKEVQGERREAQNNYRAALDFDPTYQPASANLARTTEHRGAGPTLEGL